MSYHFKTWRNTSGHKNKSGKIKMKKICVGRFAGESTLMAFLWDKGPWDLYAQIMPQREV